LLKETTGAFDVSRAKDLHMQPTAPRRPLNVLNVNVSCMYDGFTEFQIEL